MQVWWGSTLIFDTSQTPMIRMVAEVVNLDISTNSATYWDTNTYPYWFSNRLSFNTNPYLHVFYYRGTLVTNTIMYFNSNIV